MDMPIVVPGWRRNLGALTASLRMRLITGSRYRGQLLVDVMIPIVFAAMPILLGRAMGGNAAASNFDHNTGTTNYVAYMLIGSSVFTIVSYAFWNVAYWLRWEQETGTLEALYLTPTSRFWLAAGVATYSALRSLLSCSIAYWIGCWLFKVNPLQGDLLLALVFIAVGMIPLFGMTFLFGALVLKVKESHALIGLMQWVVSLLMGVFFPVAVFPPLVRLVALLFPPTWMVNDVRSSLLGIGYFFGHWYIDLAVTWAFLFLSPLLGYWVFRRVEHGIRRNEGVGQF